MKVLEVNAVPYGSTGKIAKQITECINKSGNNAIFICAWSKQKRGNCERNERVAVCFLSKAIHLFMTRITGLDGCFSIIDTIHTIKMISEYSPDIVHLHIMHSSFLNNPLLFQYIIKKDIKVVWTFHDCWNFTGGCANFLINKCEKWKNGCDGCKCYNEKLARWMWKFKEKYFAGVPRMTIVTPSKWMANLCKQSMFRKYPIKVINNGIDLDIFKPTESNFNIQYNCENKYIVLGVAFGWSEKKGLDIFIELSKKLSINYQIVLVGTDDKIDNLLPENIISIHRTKNQKQLAEIYSVANVFVNPTREDNFPTVNLEAQACGTPVITFKTGGSPEGIEKDTGCIIDSDNFIELQKKIEFVCEEHPFAEENCVKHAQKYNMNDRFKEYIVLFEKLYKEELY